MIEAFFAGRVLYRSSSSPPGKAGDGRGGTDSDLGGVRSHRTAGKQSGRGRSRGRIWTTHAQTPLSCVLPCSRSGPGRSRNPLAPLRSGRLPATPAVRFWASGGAASAPPFSTGKAAPYSVLTCGPGCGVRVACSPRLRRDSSLREGHEPVRERSVNTGRRWNGEPMSSSYLNGNGLGGVATVRPIRVQVGRPFRDPNRSDSAIPRLQHRAR